MVDNRNLIGELGECRELKKFFWKLCQGFFDIGLYGKALKLLKSISFEDEQFLDKEHVPLIWFIPLFMQWQQERVLPVISSSEYSKV